MRTPWFIAIRVPTASARSSVASARPWAEIATRQGGQRPSSWSSQSIIVGPRPLLELAAARDEAFDLALAARGLLPSLSELGARLAQLGLQLRLARGQSDDAAALSAKLLGDLGGEHAGLRAVLHRVEAADYLVDRHVLTVQRRTPRRGRQGVLGKLSATWPRLRNSIAGVDSVRKGA